MLHAPGIVEREIFNRAFPAYAKLAEIEHEIVTTAGLAPHFWAEKCGSCCETVTRRPLGIVRR